MFFEPRVWISIQFVISFSKNGCWYRDGLHLHSSFGCCSHRMRLYYEDIQLSVVSMLRMHFKAFAQDQVYLHLWMYTLVAQCQWMKLLRLYGLWNHNVDCDCLSGIYLIPWNGLKLWGHPRCPCLYLIGVSELQGVSLATCLLVAHLWEWTAIFTQTMSCHLVMILFLERWVVLLRVFYLVGFHHGCHHMWSDSYVTY